MSQHKPKSDQITSNRAELAQVYNQELFERRRLYNIAVRKAAHPGAVLSRCCAEIVLCIPGQVDCIYPVRATSSACGISPASDVVSSGLVAYVRHLVLSLKVSPVFKRPCLLSANYVDTYWPPYRGCQCFHVLTTFTMNMMRMLAGAVRSLHAHKNAGVMNQDGIASGNVRNIVVVLLNTTHQVLEKFVLSFKVGGSAKSP